MTTITPHADLIANTLKDVDALIAQNVAGGVSPELGETMKALMHSSMTQLGEHMDRAADIGEILAMFECAYANAIASVLDTACAIYQVPFAPVAATFLNNLSSITFEIIMRGEPCVSSKANLPQVGHG